MKILVFILLFSMMNQNSYALTCEESVRTFASQTAWGKIKLAWDKSLSVVNFKTYKVDSNKVYETVEKYHLGSEDATQWLNKLSESAKNGTATVEDYLAAGIILDPNRGLKIAQMVEKDGALSFRLGLEDPNLSKRLKTLILRRDKALVHLPKNVDDFEKSFFSFYDSLISPPNTTKFWNWRKNYYRSLFENSENAKEIKALYAELEKLKSGSPEDLKKYTLQSIEEFRNELKKVEAFNKNLTSEELLLKIKSEYGLKYYNYFSFKMAKGAFLLTLTGTANIVVGTKVGEWWDKKNEEVKDLNGKTMASLENQETHEPPSTVVTPFSVKVDQSISDSELVEKLKKGLQYDPLILDEKLKIVNDSNRADPIKYPCDPQGLVYNKIKNLPIDQQSQKARDFVRLTWQQVDDGANVSPTASSCLLRIKKQLILDQMKK